MERYRSILLSAEQETEETEEVEEVEETEEEEETEKDITVTVEQIDYTEYFTALTEDVDFMRTYAETTAVEQYEKTEVFYNTALTLSMTAIIGLGILIGVLIWHVLGRELSK